MRLGAITKKRSLRKAHLEAEERRYRAMLGQPFQLVSDWDHDPTVIWEGSIRDTSLKRDYEIQIRYGVDYPFRRPKVFPLDTSITGNRHQNPTPWRSTEPGDICIFQDSLDDWVVGTTSHEIIGRAIRWFQGLEAGTLGDESAPPEIERYYPPELHLNSPAVIVATSLTRLHGQTSGRFLWVPTSSGIVSFIVVIPSGAQRAELTEEVARLARLIRPHDPLDTDKTRDGLWYRVSHEPFGPVPVVTSQLIEYLGHNAEDSAITIPFLCESYIDSPPELVAICYRAGFADLHWLIYQVGFAEPATSKGVVKGFRKGTQHIMVLQQNRSTELKLYPTHHVGKESLFRRIGEPALQAMDRSTVLLLGCGAIGSRVAELLIEAGLGHIVLADKDVIRAGNVCRHALGLDQLGQPKAEALRQHLIQKNPFAVIESHCGDILSADEWLRRATNGADLVVSCIGSDAVETWVNVCSMHRSKPTFFCRVYAHSTVGEILLARPGVCCFQCVSEYLGDSGCPVPRPPRLPFEEMVHFDGDCGAPFVPGSAVDLDFTALHCARLVVSFITDALPSADYWIVRGRPFAELEDWQVDERIEAPFTVLDFRLADLSGCPVCGN